MCSTACPLCRGWKWNCPGVAVTISRLEDRVELRDRKIKWLKEYEVDMRGKNPKKWKITKKYKEE